jgi:hypothetical protein
MGFGIHITNKSIEIVQATTSDNDGSLGHFAVTTNIAPSDIAKAAALQYHDIDINNSHNLFKTVALRRKGIKGKHAKKNDDDDELSNDSDVDEATREESAPNDPKHQRISNVSLAKMAQRNTDYSNLLNFRS